MAKVDLKQKEIYDNGSKLYADIISEAAEEYGVPEGLIKAVIHQESRWKADAKGGSKDYGLMQITPITAKEMGIDHSLMLDPRENIRTGTAYLARLKKRFGGWDLALSAYNAGPTLIRKTNKPTPYATKVNVWRSMFAPPPEPPQPPPPIDSSLQGAPMPGFSQQIMGMR